MSIIRRFIFFLVLIFLFSSNLSAQTDSCHMRISLLTCSPGDELYATFGHSALRVIDSTNGQDIVYNYGTFNFDEPGFYSKFTRGKLRYYLSTDDFHSFAQSYVEEKRGITEQVLNLNCAEKYKIIQLLFINLEEKNKYYKYDFLFDNCTTRLRDLVEKSTNNGLHYGQVLSKKTSFRQLIYEYLDYNHKDWSKLGIDLLLGSKTDQVMTNRETMFLPDYLLKTFDSTHKYEEPLISSEQMISNPAASDKSVTFISPLFIFTVLFLILFALSFSNNTITKQILNSFDGFIFFITGLLGLLMVFMWFGTDHIMCRNNYNLLWAWPTHTIAAFYMYSRKKKVKYYFRLTALINILLLISWSWLPQAFNLSLIPFLLILILRSLMHSALVFSHGRIYRQEL